MSDRQGCFITLEGTEGVGKSTNLAFIESMLAEAGVSFSLTREPGGTPLAEELRKCCCRPVRRRLLMMLSY